MILISFQRQINLSLFSFCGVIISPEVTPKRRRVIMMRRSKTQVRMRTNKLEVGTFRQMLATAMTLMAKSGLLDRQKTSGLRNCLLLLIR